MIYNVLLSFNVEFILLYFLVFECHIASILLKSLFSEKCKSLPKHIEHNKAEVNFPFTSSGYNI